MNQIIFRKLETKNIQNKKYLIYKIKNVIKI